ncbi:MAG TPA: hypothetical protein VKA15_24120, partial [Isosphaeraceae bacterium]|nr:hypothetical protein [Isosphaeraceae bacterium]
MASKHAHGSKAGGGVTSSQLRTDVDRLIQKKWFKDAVKQAKLCFKQDSSPENHALLERAYYLRARELREDGMPDSALEVVGHLLEFGVTSSDWLVDLRQLLMALGLAQEAVALQERLGTADDRARLTEIAADMAVLHQERAESASAEIVRDARLVRQALERLESGDESGAIEVLRDLPRSSLLSEWKYFVRGLAAFHRRDTEARDANWGRLETRRMASRIAQRLTSFTRQTKSGPDESNDHELEKLVFGEPVIARFRRIWVLVAEQEWGNIFSELGPLRQSLRRIDPRLPERLTRVLLGPLIHEATERHPRDAERFIDRFTEVAEPSAMDPNWNRLRAVVCDESKDSRDEALVYWSRYLEDLKTIPGFTPQQRALAQAMVLNQKAGLLIVDEDESDDDEFFAMPVRRRARTATSTKAVERARKLAVDCLEQSLRLAPEYRATYKALVTLYCSVDDAANVEAAALRLLKVFPDDLETLTLLAGHYSSRDKPAEALPWVQKARALKPLDESLREQEWSTRVHLARSHAIAKRFADGRAEFAAAEQLFPDHSNHYVYLAAKAVFEARARQNDQRDAFIAKAQLGLLEPAPLWLALAIQSIRYRADQKFRAGYARLWESELKKAVKSETAGEMAWMLDSLLNEGVEYPGRDTQVKKLVTYLARSLKLSYRRLDLERVCEFLGHVPEKAALLEKLVVRGLKEHPQSARLHFEAGGIEFRKGMFGGSEAVARRHLEKAVELAGSSTERADVELLPQIKEMLSLFNDLAGSPLGSLFFGGLPFS